MPARPVPGAPGRILLSGQRQAFLRGGCGDRGRPGHRPYFHRLYHPRVRREGLQGRTHRGRATGLAGDERQGGRLMGAPAISTYSMWSLFRNCRKAFEWRYLEELVPLERDRNLALGAVIHQCLEVWHSTRQLDAVLDTIDRAYPNRDQEADEKRDWHLATAMMRGYATRYTDEEFEVVALEKTFEGKIVNPATGASSRSFTLAGKVDGVVRIGDEHYLLEHKTASQLGGDYLERLWTDFQIVLYSRYIEQTLGIRLAGVLYNVLVKARLVQSLGETEVEYEARRAALVAKSKTGKTTAKRKLPESDEAFQERLAAKYSDPQMFHRERLYLSRDRFEELQAQLWELTQAYLEARRRGVFYQNTAFCFHYRRPCAYLPLCQAGGSPVVAENLYQKVPPHEELREAVDGDESSSNDDPPF